MGLIIRILKRIFWLICYLLPVKKNKIIFQSFYGRGYSDNPKYIAEALLKQNQKLDYVWVVSKDEGNQLPEEFRTVKFRSFRYIYEISTAKIWVDNSRKEYCIKKKKQYYMQTWHGSLALKRAEKDVESILLPEYVYRAKRDAQYTDVMLSDSQALTDLYYRAFWYDGPVLQYGLPRSDILINYTPQQVDDIKESLGILPEEKVLLYAPTFRDNGDMSVYDIDFNRCTKTLEEKFGGKWKVLLRLHPNIAHLSKTIWKDERNMMDVSAYNDIQELYIISDMLITDYSSVLFDYYNLERPCLIYATDIEVFKKARDYNFTFDELPFPICKNNTELLDTIANYDCDEKMTQLRAFKNKLGTNNTGKSSEKAADWIMDKILNH